ncbi:MAG: hypothetical protein ACREQ5_09190 [Candidatus Dormibacteria bacterium]
MSWSVSAIGRAGAVAKKIAEDLAKITCAEPEETVKNHAASAVSAALAAFPEDYVVKVEASGSQTHPNWPSKEGGMVNQLRVNVEPVYGFVQ